MNEREKLVNDKDANNGWDTVAHPDTSNKQEVEAPRAFEFYNNIADETDIPILTHLNSTNPEAKTEFLSNPTLERPNNEWAKLKPSLYEENIAKIKAAKSQLENDDRLSHREKLLLKIEFDYIEKKNRLALATAKYNSATTPEEQQMARIEHQKANAELYGVPDEGTFYALLKQKIDKINVDSLSPEDRQEYDELMSMLGDLPTSTEPLYAPQQSTIDRFGEMIKIFYEPFLRHVPKDKESFTAQDAADIVNEIIRDEIGDETAWHAKVKPKAGMASVGSKSKVINFPGARSKGDYTAQELEKIIVHELGTHALRGIAYEDSTIQVFRTESFPGRETFEEGIAKAVEQSLEGKFEDPDSPAPSRYIMIGLANFRQTNFRETFEIMKRLEHLTGGWNEGQLYDNLQRVYRGTGTLPNNKDLAYYNGNINAWKFIEKNINDPNLFDRIFLSGKIDSEDSEQEYLSYEMKTGAMETGNN